MLLLRRHRCLDTLPFSLASMTTMSLPILLRESSPVTTSALLLTYYIFDIGC